MSTCTASLPQRATPRAAHLYTTLVRRSPSHRLVRRRSDIGSWSKLLPFGDEASNTVARETGGREYVHQIFEEEQDLENRRPRTSFKEHRLSTSSWNGGSWTFSCEMKIHSMLVSANWLVPYLKFLSPKKYSTKQF